MPHPLLLKVMGMTIEQFNAIKPAQRERKFYGPARERMAELQANGVPVPENWNQPEPEDDNDE